MRDSIVNLENKNLAIQQGEKYEHEKEKAIQKAEYNKQVELIAEREGENAAIRFISDELKNRPTVKGVDKLIEYTMSRSEGETHEHLKTIKQLMSKLIEGRAMYKCNSCGFDAKLLHWQCPGCKNWDTVKPVFGVDGE